MDVTGVQNQNPMFQPGEHAEEWRQLKEVLKKWPRRLDAIRLEIVETVAERAAREDGLKATLIDALGSIDNSGEDEDD